MERSTIGCAVALLLAFTVALTPCRTAEAAGSAQYVIQISVDGLGSRYLQLIGRQNLAQNFRRLVSEGAFTLNARTDFDYTVTLPNHTSMVTGRSVMDKTGTGFARAGHAWVENGEPGVNTLHSNRRGYVQSVFDVVHDRGGSTGLYASKTKFVLYDQSFDAAHGATDTIGADNGRDKIDLSEINRDSTAMKDRLIVNLATRPANYNFVHFHDPDSAGHAHGWGSTEYIKAVRKVNSHLGKLLALVESNPRLRGRTAIILSADHGGRDKNHGENADPFNYTIPFITWGAGVAKGQDLYRLNAASRRNPGTARPDYTAGSLPPIRNGDGGNLALSLLGLGPVPDSVINAAQDLKVEK